MKDAIETAREELLPLLESLGSLARDEGETDQVAFFAFVAAGVERAREADDLAEPFMELSTAAFRGFAYSAPVSFLLDQALLVAQTLSHTLSATGGDPN